VLSIRVFPLTEGASMSAKLKVHKFVVRMPFDCANNSDGDMIHLPKGYEFTAGVRSYCVNGVEVQDFWIYPDGKRFHKSIQVRGVPCNFTRFCEDELTS